MATAPPPGIPATSSPQMGPQYAPGPLPMDGATTPPGGGASRVAAETGSTALQDIARDVGQQVELMILKAKHASETKVSQEIQKIKVKMDALNEKIKLVHKKLSRLDAAAEPMLKADLQRSIDKLEEVWEGEVGTLKHELWQTIQAHNHNADLMKHHKEAIDQVQGRVAEGVGGTELQQIQEQLLLVDRIMHREQAKQQQVDQFMQRLANVQQQLTVGCGAWGGGLPLPAATPPASLGGVPPMTNPASKKAASSKKQPKAKGGAAPKAVPAATTTAAQAAAASALLPSMRAEAPEFVPTVAAPFDGGL